MISEKRRPLVSGERPRIETSLKKARSGEAIGLIGRAAVLVVVLLLGIVLANTAARMATPAGEPPDQLVLRILQIVVALIVLGVGIPIFLRSVRKAAAERKANVALYEEILHSSQIPVIEVEATRIVQLSDHPDVGNAFVCEVEPRKCLFLVAGPEEEMIPANGFPARVFEVVSYGSGDFDTVVRPLGDAIEPDESHSAKNLHLPEWEHAEVIEKPLQECLAELQLTGE